MTEVAFALVLCDSGYPAMRLPDRPPIERTAMSPVVHVATLFTSVTWMGTLERAGLSAASTMVASAWVTQSVTG
jgi:hypothetical protein